MFGIDDALLGAGLSAGANILGGMMGQQGQQATNANQMAMFQQQMNFNNQQEKIARDDRWAFAGSAYQRAAGDLQAAGLNRILALGSPASSAPGGGTSAPGAPQLGNPGAHLGAGVASAGQAASIAAQIKQTQAMTGKDTSQTDLNKASEKLVEKQGARTDQETSTSKSAENLNNATTLNKVFEGALMRANANSANAVARLNTRVAEDTERFGDSNISKAIGGVLRIINTGKGAIPSSAVDAVRNHVSPGNERRPGVPGSPVYGPTTKWNTP
jgi:hypothetical protein